MKWLKTAATPATDPWTRIQMTRNKLTPNQLNQVASMMESMASGEDPMGTRSDRPVNKPAVPQDYYEQMEKWFPPSQQPVDRGKLDVRRRKPPFSKNP